MRNDFKIRYQYRGGGIAKRGLGAALRGGGIAKRGMGVALKKGGMTESKAYEAKESKAKEMKEEKMCGGGMAKTKKYNGETSSVVRGGNVPDTTREETREAFKKRQEAKAELDQIKKDRLASKVYSQKAAQYQRELELDPPDTNPVGYNMRKFEDKVGDKIRSVGKFFGSNKMTSLDDEAQMKARQDIKGYKKGGSVSSASKRADGCAVKGKTRGKMV